jgi:hypothetical protein
MIVLAYDLDNTQVNNLIKRFDQRKPTIIFTHIKSYQDLDVQIESKFTSFNFIIFNYDKKAFKERHKRILKENYDLVYVYSMGELLPLNDKL